jgi:hypothetical protein
MARKRAEKPAACRQKIINFLVAQAVPSPTDDLGDEGLVTKVIGSRTIHRGTTRDYPLPSMGGQGAVRGPRVATYLETMA